ncbi:ectonucleoside triphosphate diphosphohydrolase 2 [Cynoglossus semilaevis]|uniref:Ectonucleoside triphosphate diphosphohydrolase 2 n=1 Tax=Cynoglossus semilaevis TaxID=244447 RepID=A0A3P8UIF4_CYNSE|nr:ectonucleoside triphosphate diphosphohydrolase 2 [Cynoglossus semilaevis]
MLVTQSASDRLGQLHFMALCSSSSALRLFLLIPLLIFGLLSLLLLTLHSEDVHNEPGFMFGIVLDAGSSHTAMFIYKWRADKQNGTGVVTQHFECHVKGGGISSYVDQPGAAGRSLEMCLDQALKEIPKERHHVTPVFLGATAGMRLLQISNPKKSSQILQEVGDKIQSYPFNFSGTSILSGSAEGAYGWVTVNYLLENFIKYGFVGRWFRAGRPTVGALDMGGASTQITFVTQEELEDKQEGMKLHLYGQEYSLYTHSFQCYGREQVLSRLLAHLVQSQGFPSLVDHPCYPSDLNRTVILGSLFSSPCTSHYVPDVSEPQRLVRVKGSGRYDLCVGNVSEIFSFQDCPFSHCSFNKVFQPGVRGSFMAFSSFFYTHTFLQRVTGSTITTSSQLGEAAKSVCNMDLHQLLLLAPDERSRLQDYCSVSVFVHILLSRGYGFDEETFPKISFQKKAGDTTVGWALGYMLSLTNLLPAETAEVSKSLTPAVWGTLVFFCGLLITAVLIFILLRVCEQKNKSNKEGVV